MACQQYQTQIELFLKREIFLVQSLRLRSVNEYLPSAHRSFRTHRQMNRLGFHIVLFAKVLSDQKCSKIRWNAIKSTTRDDKDTLFHGLSMILFNHASNEMSFTRRINVMGFVLETSSDQGLTITIEWT